MVHWRTGASPYQQFRPARSLIQPESLCYIARKLSMQPVRPYHHGKLKQALVDAAIALIAEVGTNGFTLREVARRAGVSHNAPYRHYRDRDELLAVVAMQGFERLKAAMRRSAARGSSALERLRFCGRGYVDFALRWPQHFFVMFDLPSSREKYPEYAAAGQEAFDTLLTFIVACQKEGALPGEEPEILALTAWSLVHGVAKLAISQHLPFGGAETRDFADKAARILLSGMTGAREQREPDAACETRKQLSKKN
jgi:AcrR family transcriptional regulator